MHTSLHFANGHAPLLLPAGPRRMHAGDIPWALEMADELYSGGIDKRLLTEWGTAIMHHDSYLAIRSAEAVVIAAAVPEAFDATVLNAQILFYFGRDIWQVIRLLRIAAAWAKAKGAPRIRIEDTTGRDISGIARRLKAHEDPVPVFVMEF